MAQFSFAQPRWAHLALLAALSPGCKGQQAQPERRPGPQLTKTGEPAASSSSKGLTSPPSAAASGHAASPSPSDSLAQGSSTSPQEGACPQGYLPIPGGAFKVGNAKPTYEGEENPQFETRVANFCAMATEETAAQYEACVQAGRCSKPQERGKRCTYQRSGYQNHPINCIDYTQAETSCQFLGGRLPTEVEWEYLARGGAQMNSYSWGGEEPDGRTCWKHHETCEVKSFPVGAFGLYDVTGNVWEWTSSYFTPYPFPGRLARQRVYRGGSWSRRFEKWLSPTLRNRAEESFSGSHLGVRCVADRPGHTCPYGQHEDGRCKFGLDQVQCEAGLQFNGMRCAKPQEAICPEGRVPSEEHGCIPPGPAVLRHVAGELDLSLVSRARSPEFDADCQLNQPTRPHAYRYEGGEHLARNAVGKADGCKNRDVGVGFNSSCCP